MIHEAFGRGKLLLFGEHAAVLGYPAVGLSLDRGIRLALEPLDQGAEPARPRSDGEPQWRLDGMSERENRIARELLARVAERIPGLPAAGRATSTSTLPSGRGFGSSAALCVALVEACLSAAGRDEERADRSLVWSVAHHTEIYFHGTPSGVDTGLAALGGTVAFAPRPPALPAWRRLGPLPAVLLVGSLPRSGSAKTHIARVREAGLRPGGAEEGLLARLGALAEDAAALFGPAANAAGSDATPGPGAAPGGRGGAAALGALAREAQRGLASLDLVSPDVAALIELGERAGATGGKMSGAGGGGAFWLAYATAEEARAGAVILRAEAARRRVERDLTLWIHEERSPA